MDRFTRSRCAVPVAGLVVMAFGMACTPTAEEAPPPEPAVDVAAEAATIMELKREWSAFFGARDVDAIMNLHAADAVQLPPGMEAVVG